MGDEHKPVGLIPPHPDRKDHPANGMFARVHVGGGAVMTIIDPSAAESAEWVLRYADPESIRYSVAAALGSFEYLLSGAITQAEAARRLKLMRRAHDQRQRNEWPISYADWRPGADPTRTPLNSSVGPGRSTSSSPDPSNTQAQKMGEG